MNLRSPSIEKALVAAVRLELKSGVRSALMVALWFNLILLSPLLTDDYYIRPILSLFSLGMLIAEGLNGGIRSIISSEKN
jgi:hypothetical protein